MIVMKNIFTSKSLVTELQKMDMVFHLTLKLFDFLCFFSIQITKNYFMLNLYDKGCRKHKKKTFV